MFHIDFLLRPLGPEADAVAIERRSSSPKRRLFLGLQRYGPEGQVWTEAAVLYTRLCICRGNDASLCQAHWRSRFPLFLRPFHTDTFTASAAQRAWGKRGCLSLFTTVKEPSGFK